MKREWRYLLLVLLWIASDRSARADHETTTEEFELNESSFEDPFFSEDPKDETLEWSAIPTEVVEIVPQKEKPPTLMNSFQIASAVFRSISRRNPASSNPNSEFSIQRDPGSVLQEIYSASLGSTIRPRSP